MMGNKAKYHHLIPQTYVSAWGNSSGTLCYQNLSTGEVGHKNKERILGINHYHSIFAGMPLCTKDDAREIFSILADYDVVYQGDVITDVLMFNQLFFDFDKWEITRKSNGTVASKKHIRSAIEQVKITDIETTWSSKYENHWSSIREEIEQRVLESSGFIEEFHKDFLMRFYVSLDWRSFASEPIFEKNFQRLSSVLNLDQIQIPTDQRSLPLFETVADYFRHCILLKYFRSFLNNDGPMYVQVVENMKRTSFHFLVADGSLRFITSDNPSFVYDRRDGIKAGLMPITPRILMVQCKADAVHSQYGVSHITDEDVEGCNKVIEENADQFIIMDNSGV